MSRFVHAKIDARIDQALRVIAPMGIDGPGEVSARVRYALVTWLRDRGSSIDLSALESPQTPRPAFKRAYAIARAGGVGGDALYCSPDRLFTCSPPQGCYSDFRVPSSDFGGLLRPRRSRFRVRVYRDARIRRVPLLSEQCLATERDGGVFSS